MALTFLDLTNTVLRRLNEVELTQQTFNDAVGFQAQVKDSVNRAIRWINQAEFEWPFNHITTTQVLEPGKQFYDLPEDAKTVDWDSFFLKRDSSIDANSRWLSPLDYDEWMQLQRTTDDHLSSNSDSIPRWVIRPQNFTFGVSRPPDKEYTVEYQYWGFKDNLDGPHDTTNIPDRFKFVIVDGAMYDAYMFRDNMEQSGMARSHFESNLNYMRRLLIRQPMYVRASRFARRHPTRQYTGHF